MKILVTGATGLIGRHFVRRALTTGHEIRCLTRHKERAMRILGPTAAFFETDLVKDVSLEPACAGMEAVVHLAGIFYERNDATFRRVHVAATERLIEACKKSGVKRFVLMSAFGASANARNAFLRTKGLAEESLRASGLDWTIFRPSLVYGSHDRLIYRFGRLGYFLPVVPVIAKGQNQVQPVFVNDVAECLLGALLNPVSVGKEYFLGGAQILKRSQITATVIDFYRQRKTCIFFPLWFYNLAALLSEKLLPEPLVTREHIRTLVTEGIGDISPLERDLGVKPIQFDDGVRHYLGL